MGRAHAQQPNLEELKELARGWGKIFASEAFGETGPGLDVDLARMESLAVVGAKALMAGVCEALTERQAQQLTDPQPCPGCGQSGRRKPEPHQRTIQLRVGEFELAEPAYECPTCRRDFFPSTGHAAN